MPPGFLESSQHLSNPQPADNPTPAQMSTRRSIVDMVTAALSGHEAAEEEVLWPAVRSALPDGDERADTGLQQEEEGKDVLTALGSLQGDQEEFDKLVERLSANARTHVAFEERVFLELRARMDRADLEDLGRRFVAVREAVGRRGPQREED